MKTKRKTISQDEDQIKPEPATDPARSPGSALHVVRRLRKAFLSICRCGDVAFSPYRLTTEQYSLMLAVQRDPGIRQVDVRDRIFAEPNTVTAMVTLLESRGILRRKLCAADGRARLLYLTAHGQAVMKKLSEDWEPMRALLRECFSGKAGEEALEILDTVYVEMEQERENLLQKASMDHRIFQGISPGIGPDHGKANGDASPPGRAAQRGKPGRAATPPAQRREKTQPRSGAARERQRP